MTLFSYSLYCTFIIHQFVFVIICRAACAVGVGSSLVAYDGLQVTYSPLKRRLPYTKGDQATCNKFVWVLGQGVVHTSVNG